MPEQRHNFTDRLSDAELQRLLTIRRGALRAVERRFEQLSTIPAHTSVFKQQYLRERSDENPQPIQRALTRAGTAVKKVQKERSELMNQIAHLQAELNRRGASN
jgi:hypothetical protein